MKQSVSRDLYDYWNALRCGRTAPERTDIDPAAIRHVLSYTFMLDIAAGWSSGSRDITLRLSGTRLNALFQRDLKDRAFDKLWTRRDRPAVLVMLEGVLDDRTPTVAGVTGAPWGYKEADFELLLLPLRHHGRTHARLLGSLCAISTPTWIGLRPVAGLNLTAFRTVLDGPYPSARPRIGEPARGVASPGDPRPDPVQVGHLRVYEGGRRESKPLGSGL